MKRIILLLSICFVTFNLFGQAKLRKGYIATQNGDTVRCLYQNNQWVLESNTLFVVKIDTVEFSDGTTLISAYVDSSRYSDTSLYAFNVFDSLYHADSKKWLSNIDTIPKADSTRDEFVANDSMITPIINTDLIRFSDGTFQETAAVDSSAYSDTSGYALNAESVNGNVFADTLFFTDGTYAVGGDTSNSIDVISVKADTHYFSDDTYQVTAAFDTLYHADTKTWLSNGDTIQKADSSRYTHTSTVSITDTGYVKLLLFEDGEDIIIGTGGDLSPNIGYQNVGIGQRALLNNLDGDGLVAIGVSALQANTLGYGNTGAGENVMQDNTTGYENTGFGRDVLRDNIIGHENTGVGVYSLTKAVSNNNTAIGAYSLENTTTGFGNIGFGYWGGHYNTTRSNQLFINSISRGSYSEDTTRSIIYGVQDSETVDQRLRLNANVNVTHDFTATTIKTKNLYATENIEADTTKTNVFYFDSIKYTSSSPLQASIENTEFDSINIGGYYIRFNKAEGVHEFVTAYGDVVWQGAFEDLEIGYNNTGQTITNFTPVYLNMPMGDSVFSFGIASSKIEATALRYVGAATMDIPNGTIGVACRRGKIRDGNSSTLSQMGALFLGDSVYTNTKPPYPEIVIVAGGVLKVGTTDGIIQLDKSLALTRQLKTKSYSFTSQSIAAGSYWKAGFYDSPVADANLTQASPSITYGNATVAYEAHPFAVYGGAGSVTGGGRVALIATGTSYDDTDGSQTASDPDTIINDITNAVLNIYDEAKKYLGTVTYQLVIAEGAPTAYSLDFNYGYAKYDDINDRDFYLTGIECVWLGDGSDATGFDIELYNHSQTGWTYSAAAFSPGNGVIAQRSVDQAGFLNVVNNQESAWKRSSLNTFIDGSDEGGFLLKVTTGSISTIQTMDIHVEVAID